MRCFPFKHRGTDLRIKDSPVFESIKYSTSEVTRKWRIFICVTLFSLEIFSCHSRKMEGNPTPEDQETDDSNKQLVPSVSGGAMTVSLSPFVKSTAAVVKYGFNRPLQFLQLSANTNLNKAPSNWLRSSSNLEKYIRQASQPKQKSHFTRCGIDLLY